MNGSALDPGAESSGPIEVETTDEGEEGVRREWVRFDAVRFGTERRASQSTFYVSLDRVVQRSHDEPRRVSPEAGLTFHVAHLDDVIAALVRIRARVREKSGMKPTENGGTSDPRAAWREAWVRWAADLINPEQLRPRPLETSDDQRELRAAAERLLILARGVLRAHEALKVQVRGHDGMIYACCHGISASTSGSSGGGHYPECLLHRAFLLAEKITHLSESVLASATARAR